MRGKLEIVQVLEKYPDGTTIDVLITEMGLTDRLVRSRINAARARGYSIVNVGYKTF